MKKSLLALLLLAHFLKELLWLSIVPIWHFPDEEQHFGLTAFLAEKQYYPQNNEFDVSQEIDRSSELLGTKRDKRGINKFTYHPEYRISYTKSQVGLYEEEIRNLNTEKNRTTMVKREAALYGPTYYFLTTIPYKLFGQADLLVRLFSSRFVSLILSTLTVFFAWLIARQIFKKDLLIFTAVFLVSFQPMFSFVSAGINSDNLFNLIFTLIIFCCLKLFFQTQFNLKYLVGLLLSFILGFYTKRQIVIALPIVFFAFLIYFFKNFKKKRKFKKQSLAVVGLVILIYFILTRGSFKIPEYSFGSESLLKENFFQYIFWHLRHTVAETIPWYWGVFNWLGVVLPRWVNQVQARILILAALGILVYFYQQIKKKVLGQPRNLKIIFLFLAAAIYYFSIICWDYFFRQVHPYSFGIQGRYFFPTIVSHMLLIILGLITLIPKKFKNIFLRIFNLWWLVFSLIGLWTATTAYYQIWPAETFLNQVSQYKPVIFKAAGIISLSSLYLVVLLVLIINFFRLNEKKN